MLVFKTMQVTAGHQNIFHELYTRLKPRRWSVIVMYSLLHNSTQLSCIAWNQCLHESVICYHSNNLSTSTRPSGLPITL